MFRQSSNASRERRLSGPHRSVVVLLCTATALASASTFVLAFVFRYKFVLDAGVLLAVVAGVLLGVSSAAAPEPGVSPEPSEPPEPPATLRRRLTKRLGEGWRRLPPGLPVATLGLLLVGVDLVKLRFSRADASQVATIVAVVACVLAALVAGLSAHYFAGAASRDRGERLTEAPALQRGARVATWLFIVVAGEIGAIRLGQQATAWSLHGVALGIATLTCVELLFAKRRDGAFPVDLRVLAALGRRANLFASLLDTAQEEFGIDLRATWALAVARRFAQPLVLALCVLGWLSTGITIIGTNEVGLVERFGTVADTPPLPPGIHVHLPWPIDRVRRIDATRIRSLTIGHEDSRGGPEDVLWARQHTPNEYSLLLGDGHDLITIDAQLQYRVRDARAYAYTTQNPDNALRAIGYRAVMRATVSRTLADTLSENVATLTGSIQKTIQDDADRLGLGVEVVGFTIGGMHPPVAVALDYQGVVSAELTKVTDIVDAQRERNQTVPAAEAAAFVETTGAKADAAAEIAKAAADAWSFRALQAQYTTAPDEYRFRRRLEALEQALSSRHFTIVDARIMRDGGELWLNP
jgi:regulator of protease activity HflC (stomatin/prohibitin superfamily)